MKKIIVFAVAAFTFTACDNQKSTETTIQNTDTTATMGTTTTVTDNTMSDNTMTTNSYVPAEGDVMYRDGKVMVWRGNSYVASDNDVTQDNGVVVKRNGEVMRDGRTGRLEDGEAVSKTGRFFNKAGEAIDDGWDATKKGARKAGEAIKKGANKVGEEVKDAVN